MRKVISFVICFLLVLSVGGVAFAANDSELSLSPNPDYAESEIFTRPSPRAAGSITYAYAAISRGSGYLLCKADTDANALSDKLGAYMVLQKWDGGSWTTYKTGSDYGNNCATYKARVSFSVGSGTYRLVAYHRTYNGGSIFNQVSRTTTSITV